MAGVVFDPEERWLAAVTAYRFITFWPLEWPRARALQGHTSGPIMALRFTPDSQWLASCARDGTRLWPLSPGKGHHRRVKIDGDYLCYGIDASPNGDIAIAAPLRGLYLTAGASEAPRLLLRVAPTCVLQGVAFDPEGRRVVAAPQAVGQGGEKEIYVVDLQTDSVRSIPLTLRGSQESLTGLGGPLAFSWDGALLSGGYAGVRSWDLETGESTILLDRPAGIAASADGRRLVAMAGDRSGLDDTGSYANMEIVVIDLTNGSRRTVTSHGADVRVAALDATGQTLITGDEQGVVRIGPSSGAEPHVLPGHSGLVSALAPSPDGRWIASAAGTEVRLWPMPDRSTPPLHTLPYEELIGRLRSLTNIEVVEDDASPTGYRVELGPFPGWKNVPAW